MCGRYTLSTPADLVAELFDLEEPLELEPRYNIAPTQPAPIVRLESEGRSRTLRLARWGLVPWWADDISIGNRMINARSETVTSRRAFRDSFRARRCLVPADGFFEWQPRSGAGKQPFHLTLADGAPFAFAGLYDFWRNAENDRLESFTILTTQPNGLVKPIHDRMPVILPRDSFAPWLEGEPESAESLQELLIPYPAERMLATPVGPYVGNPRNEGPACVEEAVPAAEQANLGLFD